MKATMVAVTAALTGVLVAQPASAAQEDYYYNGTHAAVDNHPGNGAASWVWVYGSTIKGASGGTIQYQLTDLSGGGLSVGRGKTAYRNNRLPVRAFRACMDWNADGEYGQSCGSWRFL
jgi:hypothetical protein